MKQVLDAFEEQGYSSISKKQLTSKQLANLVAAFAADKKADAITILDMRELVNFCDYFVICTGSSERHLRAVTDGVEQGLAAKGIKVNFSKGLRGLPTNPDDANGAWVLLDMGDVIIHVFDAQAREFYGLEHLWQAAPKVEFKSH